MLLILLVLGLAVLHIAPIHRLLGTYAIPLLALGSFARPETGLLFLGASISLANPSRIGLTSTQIGVIAWVLLHVVKLALGQRQGLFVPRGLVGYVLSLFAGWLLLMSAVHGEWDVQGQALRGLAVAFAVYDLSRQTNSLRRSFAYLLIGSAMIGLDFWFPRIGLQGFAVTRYTGLLGEHVAPRLASVKQDPNALGMLAAATMLGGVGIHLCGWPKAGRLAFLLVMATLPTMVGGASRGSYAALAGASVFLLLTLLRAPESGCTGRVAGSVAMLGFVFAMSWLLVGHETRLGFARAASVLQVGLDDRGRLAERAIAMILGSPILGPSWASYMADSYLFPHNTYLDYGVASGIPGMLLFIATVGSVLLPWFRRRPPGEVIPILVVYLFCCINIAFLSAVGDKMFWALWALLAHAKAYRVWNDMPSAEGTTYRDHRSK